MNIFDLSPKTNTILALDIFKMLGLETISDEDKDDYLRRFTQLILEYFFQEKLGGELTVEEIEVLMKKYPPKEEKNIEAFLEEVGQILPNASELFTEAMTEVKAKLVYNHYAQKSERYEEMILEENDLDRKDVLQQMLDQANLNIKYMDENKWEMIQWLNQDALEENSDN